MKSVHRWKRQEPSIFQFIQPMNAGNEWNPQEQNTSNRNHPSPTLEGFYPNSWKLSYPLRAPILSQFGCFGSRFSLREPRFTARLVAQAECLCYMFHSLTNRGNRSTDALGGCAEFIFFPGGTFCFNSSNQFCTTTICGAV